MLRSFKILEEDVKFCKRIYEYITPILLINEEWIERFKENDKKKDKDKVKYYMLILNMRNTACHHILDGNYFKQLFVNIVKLYQVFELKLLNKKRIKDLWNKIDANLKKFKLCTQNGTFIYDEEINKLKDKNFKKFYNYFKNLLDFINNSKIRSDMFEKYKNPSKTKIKLIYNYIAPIVMWYQNVADEFKNEYSDDLLFKICYYTRTCVSHFSEMVVDESFLIQLMKNITIVYLAFGLDINSSIKNVNKMLVEQSFLSEFYVNVNEKIKFDNESKSIQKDGNEIISQIRNILCNKNDKLNEKYFLFGKFLHYFVSTKISKGDMNTQVFLKNENNVEWCRIENRFIIKDVKINSDKRSILKFSGPLFVWFETASNLIEFNKNQEFYLTLNELRQRIINYLIINEDNAYEENYILLRMESIYEPIGKYFSNIDKDLCSNNLENIQCYHLFMKLVNHSVFARIGKQFSLSFLFKYFYKRENISNEMENQAKMYDIFNFCGIFFIFVSCFENNLKALNDCFYGKVKVITDQITQYMIHEIRNTHENNGDLQNQIIQRMKSIFSDFREVVISDNDLFYEIFSQLYSHIVTSRSNVEISNSNSDDDIREIGNATGNLLT